MHHARDRVGEITRVPTGNLVRSGPERVVRHTRLFGNFRLAHCTVRVTYKQTPCARAPERKRQGQQAAQCSQWRIK